MLAVKKSASTTTLLGLAIESGTPKVSEAIKALAARTMKTMAISRNGNRTNRAEPAPSSFSAATCTQDAQRHKLNALSSAL